ncbi:hypothetical protein [Pseudoxanthomonas sp. JBR18]|uniref:hypothetical protein n=1 Tax=Pseudoxanthomonas sp. JBR18 TaxID=2969308 RepID=UPI002305D880|nr:hypothetical protein [Pseudoxanthomonas sp. JBR18]WCE03170.1 hypothetical protein PJ250_13725 [Pseudoxanthomonas sp. JBR18]
MFTRKPPTDPVTVLVDGLQVETNEAGKLAIEKLQAQLAELITARDSATEALTIAKSELSAAKAAAARLADSNAQQVADLQRQLDEAKAPPAASISERRSPQDHPDPVARALADRAAFRQPAADNGYGAFVDSLDYRTRQQETGA